MQTECSVPCPPPARGRHTPHRACHTAPFIRLPPPRRCPHHLVRVSLVLGSPAPRVPALAGTRQQPLVCDDSTHAPTSRPAAAHTKRRKPRGTEPPAEARAGWWQSPVRPPGGRTPLWPSQLGFPEKVQSKGRPESFPIINLGTHSQSIFPASYNLHVSSNLSHKIEGGDLQKHSSKYS